MKRLISTMLLFAAFVVAASAQYENRTIKIGQKAPELAYPNPEGKTIKLSEINKGRYVLIDFWASWCMPCRASNPGLVSLYSEYSKKKFKGAKKGFTVLNVSLDQKKDAWINAIKRDNLSWPNHMSDLGGWNSKAAAAYGIMSIPQAMLIGPDGKVLGMYQRSEEARPDLDKYVVQ